MTLDINEVDGRILMLTQQRSEALDRCVLLAGRLNVLENRLKALEAQLAKLNVPTDPPPSG